VQDGLAPTGLVLVVLGATKVVEVVGVVVVVVRVVVVVVVWWWRWRCGVYGKIEGEMEKWRRGES
jgi:hypothetical protein